ncbi:MAG: hypothetical protein G01um101430_126 [Parcubacteria group bacterium Gr01-1014_30]|nr:MAG: hypothetical protein G01um101430_126 [Parcubacteria group bacterium Gr01-1014_30]
MQKNLENNKIIIITLSLLAVLGVFYFYWKSGKSSSINENVVTEKIVFEAVPKNYLECMETENKYNFRNRNRSMLSCSYTVFPEEIPNIDPQAVDKNKYDECVKEKGHPISFAGDCSFLFYNPDYTFPQSFRECVDEKKGEFTTSVRPRCMINITVLGAANVDVANNLINKCVALGGMYSEEFGRQCYIEFDESNL